MVTAERVLQLRRNANISQVQLAHELGVGQKLISYLEGGKSLPNAEIINRLARRFNVSSDYLVGLTDDPTPNWKTDNVSEYSWLTALELNRLPPGRQELIYKVVVMAIANLGELEKGE
jgi:transcriptional regulator with XRE-family HTH domain